MANPRVDPSQEVLDASWEPADMPAVGDVVHFYTTEARHQWAGVGEGPYAAVVTAHGEGGKLGLYVLPCSSLQMPMFYDNVPPTMEGLRWWLPKPLFRREPK